MKNSELINFKQEINPNISIRPIRPEDESLMIAFHQSLSEQSVYFRWLSTLGLEQRISHERLSRVCAADQENEVVLVAEWQEAQTELPRILGVGRLTRLKGSNEAEIAIIISDCYQRQGIGSEMMRRLIQIGHERGYERLVGDVHPENFGMQKTCRNLGFKVGYSIEDEVTKVALQLAA